MGWETSGQVWGSRAAEWAYLFEPYARSANTVLLDRLEVGEGTRLLDVACGSGYAVRVATERGALVTGLDASQALVDIARARTPEADLRVGDMFALPFADASFDAATSFNGIWKGCEDALREVRRTVRPGGTVGLTFWGSPKRMGLFPYFAALARFSPPDHAAATIEQGDTGRPGVVERMLEEAGIEPTGRGTVVVTNEWPDVATGVRALCAAGPAWPALQADEPGLVAALTEALTPMVDAVLGLRVESEFGWVTGRVPERS